MNQQQIKYTLERIALVEKRKIADLKTACTVPARHIEDAEIIELIRSKKVKLRDDFSKRERYACLAVTDIYDLSKHMNTEHLTAAYAPGLAAITAAARKVSDEVMLGDNAEALLLLREFEAA